MRREPEKAQIEEQADHGKKWWIFGGAAVLAAVVVLLVVVLGGKGKLFGGQDGLTEEMAAGPGDVQADDSGEMPKLSLCFHEAILKQGMSDAKVYLINGHDNPDGEIFAEFSTQPDGTVETELAAGEYTLCWEAEGYYSGYENLTVGGGETCVVKQMLPVLTGEKAYVLIEWDSDKDLDLCVFNAQTNQYINIRNAVDDAGDFLYFDNGGADGYELICLNDYTAGIYTVYVRDAESLLQETGSVMEAEGLTVSIYTADGLLYREKADTAEMAALWSPVYLYQGEAIALKDYIYDTTDYAWAVCDKNDESYAQNEEVWSAEEDAALLANLQVDDSCLRRLMEELVHHLVDDNIKSLLCGEKKGIEAFFAGEEPAAKDLSYVRENQPANSDELFERTGTGYFLTEEQAQYLLYSICGKQMDFDFSAEDIGIAGYIGFGGHAGDISWDRLEHLSVERVDANTWKVRANDVYCTDGEPSWIVSRVCFTVVKNPDSCFDGYSLAGFEVEEKANRSWWAKIYYDYLTTDPEGIAIIENNYGLTWQGHFSDTDPETGEWIDLAPDDIVLVIDWYQLNETEVTEEQYVETINSYTGGAEFQQCRSYDEYIYYSLQQYLFWWSTEE